MKKFLIISTVLFIITSCQKEEIPPMTLPDYRENYTGNYEYELIVYSWQMGQPSSYDTSINQGLIRFYEYGDYDSNLYSSEETGDTSNTIAIEFGPMITSEVTTDGLLVEKFGYHYHHQGYFVQDSIYFSVTGLGGLGGGADYYVRGAKL